MVTILGGVDRGRDRVLRSRGSARRPTVSHWHAEHGLRVMSLRRRYLGAVRDELRSRPVTTRTGNCTQVTVGTVPLEGLAGRTGTGAGVPARVAARRRMFLRGVFADDYDDRFVFSPQPESVSSLGIPIYVIIIRKKRKKNGQSYAIKYTNKV